MVPIRNVKFVQNLFEMSFDNLIGVNHITNRDIFVKLYFICINVIIYLNIYFIIF